MPTAWPTTTSHARRRNRVGRITVSSEDEAGQLETRETYERISTAYADRQSELPWQGSWLKGLIDRLAAKLRPGAVVADLGCGPGLHVAYLRSLGLSALGLDQSQAMVGQAVGVTKTFVVGSIQELPIRSGSVDGVWSSFALLHVPIDELPHGLAEIFRVLVPGGYAELTFAGGGESPYREAVPYRREHFRTFHPIGQESVASIAASCGFRVVAQGDDPTGHRAAHHILLERPAG